MKDLVLLNGWGFNAGIWHGITPARQRARREMPALTDHFNVHCLNYDEQAKMPARAIVCGWSLGAQIAMRWALQSPTQIEKLILIAATPCFMQRENWKNGMSPATFANFAQGLDKDATGTLQRFAALVAHGDVNAKSMTRTLREALPEMPASFALGVGLTQLAQTDLRNDVANIQMPALVIHGANDAITPASAGQWLAEKMPAAQFELWTDTAHAPFLSNPEKFVQQVKAFCDE